ncbi:hypothetical protein [Henriciella aquimarina]|uniref:hypothetical protein n=1 Tax=Henriciella aquimarina TaxID=545261 RepID=UPI0009FC9280|nr:hypothetical protein [Henriciella aquimarina]
MTQRAKTCLVLIMVVNIVALAAFVGFGMWGMETAGKVNPVLMLLIAGSDIAASFWLWRRALGR